MERQSIPAVVMPLVAVGYGRLVGEQTALRHPGTISHGHVAYTIIDESVDGFSVQMHRDAWNYANWKRRKDQAESGIALSEREKLVNQNALETLMKQKDPMQIWADGYVRNIERCEADTERFKADLAEAMAVEPTEVPPVVWRFDAQDSGMSFQQVRDEPKVEAEPKPKKAKK